MGQQEKEVRQEEKDELANVPAEHSRSQQQDKDENRNASIDQRQVNDEMASTSVGHVVSQRQVNDEIASTSVGHVASQRQANDDQSASTSAGHMVSQQQSNDDPIANKSAAGQPVRRWRVGTISMGLSLIILGSLLFLHHFVGLEDIESFFVWWPLILILLGIEILIYLLFNRQARVKYDILSIFFISVLGSVAILFTVLTSLGLADDFRSSLYQESKTYTLPSWNEAVAPHIEKIVIITGNQRINIDQTEVSALQMIGTYRTYSDRSVPPTTLTKDDVATMDVVGNVIYVHIKDMHRVHRPFHTNNISLNATMIVPAHIELEVHGRYQWLEG